MEFRRTQDEVAELKRREAEAYEAEDRERAEREKYLELGNRAERRRLKALGRKVAKP